VTHLLTKLPSVSFNTFRYVHLITRLSDLSLCERDSLRAHFCNDGKYCSIHSVMLSFKVVLLKQQNIFFELFFSSFHVRSHLVFTVLIKCLILAYVCPLVVIMGNLESLVVPGYPFELDQNLVACRDPFCQYYGAKHPEANGIHCRVRCAVLYPCSNRTKCAH
jgi:hypothetical protein